MLLKVTLIFIYIIFVLVFYTFINKRLRYLNDKHITHTWVPYLRKSYLFIMSVISFLALITVILSIILILTLL